MTNLELSWPPTSWVATPSFRLLVRGDAPALTAIETSGLLIATIGRGWGLPGLVRALLTATLGTLVIVTTLLGLVRLMGPCLKVLATSRLSIPVSARALLVWYYAIRRFPWTALVRTWYIVKWFKQVDVLRPAMRVRRGVLLLQSGVGMAEISALKSGLRLGELGTDVPRGCLRSV